MQAIPVFSQMEDTSPTYGLLAKGPRADFNNGFEWLELWPHFKPLAFIWVRLE